MRRRDFVSALMGTIAVGATGAAAPLPALAPGGLRGLYRSAGGEILAVGAFTEFGEGEFFFDYQGLSASKLVPTGTDGYRVSTTFTDDGEELGMLEPAPGGVRYRSKLFRASRTGVRRFTAKNGAVEIAGEFSYNVGSRPRGTIIPIWGSGPGPHQGLDYWRFYFLSRGWAVATYDKRGSGASSGDWRVSGFDDLAGDVRAVLDHVQTRLASPRAPIGLVGLSQGGWIAPMLASEVDFLMLHGAAVVTPAQQTLAFVKGELQAYGFIEAEISEALAYYALDIEVSRGRRPWAELQLAYEAAIAKGAEWILRRPLAADAPERIMWRLIADFDPAPLWRSCTTPVLAIFGEKDLIVPPEPNARLLGELLPAVTERRIGILTGANHLGMLAERGVMAEYPRCTRIAPDYFPAIAAWLAQR